MTRARSLLRDDDLSPAVHARKALLVRLLEWS